MTAAQQVNEFVWKPGRNGSIEFCGNSKRLQEKEPKTAALLLGHFDEEGFQTEDVNYTYKIYHSQYGYSVGRRKKPVVIPDIEEPLSQSLPKIPQTSEIAVYATSEQMMIRMCLALEDIAKTLKNSASQMTGAK